MGPSNDHELEIARRVDQLAIRKSLDAAEALEAIARLDFRMTESDYRFLKEYIRWRMDHPIVK